MRLKTFLAAYILFLGILFTSIGIVSAHMTRSTTYMLQEKAAREFQTITTTLAREMANIFARFPGGMEYQSATNEMFGRYAHYYLQHNIHLNLTQIHGNNGNTVLTFERYENRHFIKIEGNLPLPAHMGGYMLTYTLDITTNINDMQDIQRYLWLTSIIVSVIASALLYIILLRIFKPLGLVASAAEQIAQGQYGNRITVRGQNELAAVAVAFNRMCEQIESQIHLLESEAERKQQFVDNFAHEIRTPLTSIYGYAEYLQKASLTEGGTGRVCRVYNVRSPSYERNGQLIIRIGHIAGLQTGNSPNFYPGIASRNKARPRKAIARTGHPTTHSSPGTIYKWPTRLNQITDSKPMQ